MAWGGEHPGSSAPPRWYEQAAPPVSQPRARRAGAKRTPRASRTLVKSWEMAFAQTNGKTSSGSPWIGVPFHPPTTHPATQSRDTPATSPWFVLSIKAQWLRNKWAISKLAWEKNPPAAGLVGGRAVGRRSGSWRGVACRPWAVRLFAGREGRAGIKVELQPRKRRPGFPCRLLTSMAAATALGPSGARGLDLTGPHWPSKPAFGAGARSTLSR